MTQGVTTRPAKPTPEPHFRRGARPSRHQARRAAAVLSLADGLIGRALDYGAGWGDLTARLAPQFDVISGVDVSPDRAAFAAQEYAPLEFRCCPSTHLEEPDASFDVVFSTVVLHFVPSPEAYLEECRRVLRPDGHLIVMIQNPESMWILLQRARGRSSPRPGWHDGNVKTWGGSLGEFETWLESQHFAIEQTRGFYDPALDRLRGLSEVALSVMNLIGHWCRIPRHWSYVGYRCRRMA